MYEDEIYAKLLGGDLVIGKKICSPLPPVDAHPSFWLFRSDSGEILWHDARLSHKYNRSAIGLAMEMWGCSWGEAKDRLGRLSTPLIRFVEPPTPKRGTVVSSVQDWEMPFWEAHATSRRSLSAKHVYGLRGFYIDGGLMYQSEKNNAKYVYVCGSNSYQMYKPYEDRTFRFRGHNIKDVLFGYNSIQSGGDLIITSSMKDVIMFHNIGMQAVAPTSEGVFSGIRKKYGELRLRFDKIYVIFDNDKKGREATQALCGEMSGLEPCYFFGPEKDGADVVKNWGLDVFKGIINQIIK